MWQELLDSELLLAKLKVSGKNLGCIRQPTFTFDAHSSAQYKTAH